MTENMKEAEYVKITEETTEGTATETVTEEKVVVSGDDSGRQGDSIENYGYEEVPGEDITGFEELAGFGEMSDTKNDQEQRLFRIMDEMDKVDRNAMIEALERQEKLAKPPGSLGGLEEISIRMAGITGKVKNSIEKSCVVVMCADNGVVEEGVSSAPQSVTMAQTVNFTRRLTGVGALAQSFGSELLIVDLGVKDPIPEELYDNVPLRDTHKIVNRRVRPGTCNIAREPAMTKDEVIRCIMTGIEMADAVKDAGFDIAGVGEMGIGNTTTSAAVLSALTGLDSSETCGRGGGVNDAGIKTKKENIDTES